MPVVDESMLDHFVASQAANRTTEALARSSGDGQPPGMDTEIALLKQRADQTDQRLGRMEGKLDQISDALRHVATKEDVKRAENASWNGLAVGGSVAIAIMALFVGVLAYLQDQRITNRPDTPALPPIILNLPAAPTPPTPLPPATPAP